ncbi:MAG: hypothetical protein Q8K92_10255 [Leadbetterella sp.]|nr:hypothetical protein [Leadbetterella sp.]
MKKVLLFSFLSFIIFSCKNESPIPESMNIVNAPSIEADLSNDQKENILVFDNRIIFKSFDVYSQTIQELQKMDDTDRNDWFEKYKILSLNDYYKKQVKDNLVRSLDLLKDKNNPVIPDNTFNRIVNKDGVFQIGNRVIKYEFDKGKFQNIETFKKVNFEREFTEFEAFVEFAVKDKDNKIKNLRPSDFVGSEYQNWYHSTAGTITVHGWNEVLGYYIGFGGSATSNITVDYMHLTGAGTYRKSGAFGHHSRSGYWNYQGNSTSYQGGTWQSSGTVPQFFNRYVIDIAVNNRVSHSGHDITTYYIF